MAVQFSLLRSTAGQFTRDGGEAVITACIRFDEPGYDAVAAVAECEGRGYRRGQTTYAFGESVNPRLILDSFNPQPGPTKHTFHVEMRFKENPPSDAKQPDPSWPLQPEYEPPTVRVTHRGYQSPVIKSRFVGFFDAGGGDITESIGNPYFVPDSIRPVANSAEVPLLPPREKTLYFTGVIVTWYTLQTWRFHRGPGYVNRDRVRLAVPAAFGSTRMLFDATFAKRTLLCVDSQWEPAVIGGVPWNRITYELLYDPGGWYDDELDRGVCARALPGDPDGNGGMISGGSVITDGPAVRRILDRQGNPVTDPVPLDGRGQPLTSADPDDAIFLRWFDHDEISLQALPNAPFYDPE